MVAPVAWAIACGKTEDCAETQTCIETGGEGGESDAGDGGTTSGTSGNGGRGGASGGNGGSAARGGTAGSGTSGAGTGGGGDEAPTVVSVTLDGGEETEDVDVYAELVIEFSEAIAEETLTAESVNVTVAGHQIAGEVTVDDATHATFTPLERYYLTAEHTLTVTTDVTDTGGTAFEEDYELGFTVRDGAWTHMVAQAPDPLPNTDDQMKAAMGVDGQGNVLVAWATRPSSFYARWYRQGSGWGPVETLSSTLDICPVSCRPVHAAVNKNGDAVVATASASNVSVYQYRNGSWSSVMAVEVGETPPSYTGIGISDIGEVHVMTARTMSAQAGALITRRTTTTGAWRPVAETGPGTLLGRPPRLAFDANGNGLAVWSTSPNAIAYSIYEQASGTWSARAVIPRSDVGGPGEVAVALRPEGDGIVAWSSEEGSNQIVVRVANYTGTGFADVDATVVSDIAEQVAVGPALAFDGTDFIAAWGNFGGTASNSAWSARRRNGTWLAPQEVSAEAGRYAPPSLGADASGNTMALVRVPTMDSWEEPYWNRYRRTTGAWSATATRLLDAEENRDDPAPALVVAPNGVAAAAMSYRASEKMFLFDTSILLFE